jgi:hypothetical protein
LLETLARNPQANNEDYVSAIKYTNKLLEKEFYYNEKLSELFLTSKKGKEVLLLLAKNKEFESINNWLSRTKQSLPAETRELIKGNDLHQRDARKSLASASSSTDSSSDKCLRFLRLVSLKYSK